VIFRKLTNEESFVDKNLEKELVRLSEPLFKAKTFPSLAFAKEIGNMYTPSLYACLISHLLR
jgi:hydroxymethylglutaryl-CoA synthase